MRLCVCAYIRIFLCWSVCVCMRAWVSDAKRVCMRVCESEREGVCMCVGVRGERSCVYACMYECVPSRVCVYA